MKKALNLYGKDRTKFKKCILNEMARLGMSIPDLANKIGYDRKSVWKFFHDDDILNKYLAGSIDNYFHLDWRNYVERSSVE